MAEGEKIDLIKAVKSPLTVLYWIKTIMIGLGISSLLFVGYGVYGYYFKKKPPTQDITVAEGGQLTIRNEGTIKRHLILFAEPYVSVDTADKSSIGIRAGIRWEF